MKTMKATITVGCQQICQDQSHVFFLPFTTYTRYMGLISEVKRGLYLI